MPLSIFEYLLITTLLALTIDEIPNLVTWLIRKEKDTRVKQAIRKWNYLIDHQRSEELKKSLLTH
jgi:hypothetical protein